MENAVDIISNLGFPIGVSAFLLIRIEKKLDELNKTILQVLEAFVKNE
jgi:hypothetical protein